MTHKKRHETEVTGLNGLASQKILLQRKNADALSHTSGAVVSLLASLENVCEEVRRVSKERDEFRVKWEQADRADEDMSTLAKRGS